MSENGFGLFSYNCFHYIWTNPGHSWVIHTPYTISSLLYSYLVNLTPFISNLKEQYLPGVMYNSILPC